MYLGSAELAAVCALLGKIPTIEEYLRIMEAKVHPNADQIYRLINDQTNAL